MLSIVLSRRDLREFDQMITLLTLEQGKVEALARGVKKIVSKNSAALEPFFYVDAELLHGKEMFHIGSVQPLEAFVHIRSDLTKIRLAAHSVALCDKLLVDRLADAHIFQLLLGWLVFLNENEIQYHFLLDSFVIKLLRVLGFDVVSAEVECGVVVQERLTVLADGNWQVINALPHNRELEEKTHNIIFQFTTYHAEQQLVDW